MTVLNSQPLGLATGLRRLLLGYALIGCSLLGATPQSESGNDESSDDTSAQIEQSDRPQVLILGDSISMGYTRFVQQELEGTAIVKRPMNAKGRFLNCQGTTLGVKQLDQWLGGTPWAVIHFNFGLHDLKHVDPNTGKNSNDPSHPQQASPEQYEANLEKIVERLKQTGARLVFANTTPYPDRPSGPLRLAADVAIYNAAASRVMQRHKIPIHDLHAFVLPDMDKLQQPNNVHFHQQGSRALAKQVVAAIRAQLAQLDTR